MYWNLLSRVTYSINYWIASFHPGGPFDTCPSGGGGIIKIFPHFIEFSFNNINKLITFVKEEMSQYC